MLDDAPDPNSPPDWGLRQAPPADLPEEEDFDPDAFEDDDGSALFRHHRG